MDLAKTLAGIAPSSQSPAPATGGLAYALTVLICWGAWLVGWSVPNEVSSALVVVGINWSNICAKWWEMSERRFMRRLHYERLERKHALDCARFRKVESRYVGGDGCDIGGPIIGNLHPAPKAGCEGSPTCERKNAIGYRDSNKPKVGGSDNIDHRRQGRAKTKNK